MAALALAAVAGPATACEGLDAAARAKFTAYAADCAPAGPEAEAWDAEAPDLSLQSPPEPISVAILLPAAARPAPAPARAGAGTRSALRPTPLVEAVARSHRIDPVLLTAIVAQESAGRPLALSSKGAVGLMQVMPATARGLGIADAAALRDPALNLRAGATYLKQLQAQFGNDLALTLAAYNAGPAAVRRHRGVPPYAETRGYVGRILGRYRTAAEVGR